MKIFKVNKDISIACEWKKTRTAFKHEAILLVKGREVDRTKICYLNRTWERFEFESVIEKLLDKTQILKGKAREKFLERAYKGECEETNKQFGLIGAIASLGNVLTNDKKDKNVFKSRILKAGLEKQGLDFPDDWDKTDEDTKEARLNGVINPLTEKS